MSERLRRAGTFLAARWVLLVSVLLVAATITAAALGTRAEIDRLNASLREHRQVLRQERRHLVRRIHQLERALSEAGVAIPLEREATPGGTPPSSGGGMPPPPRPSPTPSPSPSGTPGPSPSPSPCLTALGQTVCPPPTR